ncbi:sensor histidine kinase [Micromonospora chokoriensis]|uniref:sensor histidine kinase n=1 Tax=Micromonospora chokoriensis TaxID=356851 RepID=UPI00068E704F|nr:ATP-binding protein [Micromonospora chokoriensis]
MIGSWRGSLRVRLTLVISAVLLLGGSTVLGGTLIVVNNGMEYSLAVAYGKWRVYRPDDPTPQVILDTMQSNLLLKCGLTVVVVWLVGTAVGWFVSGQLLRPLNMITATAHRIAGRTLHQRIALNSAPGEVKSLADSFDSMLDRLDEAFAGQDRFIANAAHELKTPIAVNRVLVEVAMGRPDYPVELRQLGENLLAVNHRHERLIESLLTLARAEHTITNTGHLDLAELATRAAQAVEPRAAEKQVRIATRLGSATVLGDPLLLQQLIYNLVDNAVRYNQLGGTVWVSTSADAERAEVMVSNTGPVILSHEVPTLFEPFRRLTDRVGTAEGSGLGLSIVRAVVRAHGGDADAAPHPGGGLSVRVTLPRKRAATDGQVRLPQAIKG